MSSVAEVTSVPAFQPSGIVPWPAHWLTLVTYHGGDQVPVERNTTITQHTGASNELSSVMEDEEEGARVLGLGVGLFLIILTWSLALAAALLMARTAAGSGVTIVTIATLVTLLLLVIPRQVPTIFTCPRPRVAMTISSFLISHV